jgi:hypothetical protein
MTASAATPAMAPYRTRFDPSMGSLLKANLQRAR